MRENQEIRAKAVELLVIMRGNDEIAHAIAKRPYEFDIFDGTALDSLVEYITTGKKPEVK